MPMTNADVIAVLEAEIERLSAQVETAVEAFGMIRIAANGPAPHPVAIAECFDIATRTRRILLAVPSTENDRG
jgi:hypothetical protein